MSVIASLESKENELEKFATEVLEEIYQNWAGKKDEVETEKIYNKYSHLFEKKNITSVKRLLSTASRKDLMTMNHHSHARNNDDIAVVSQDLERRGRYLLVQLASGFLDRRVARISDKIETIETKKEVVFDGEKIPYRQALVMMVKEGNRQRRKKLYGIQNQVTEELNPLYERRMVMLHNLARSLGFKSYYDMFSKLKKINYQKFESDLRRYTKAAEGIYKSVLEESFSKIGVDLKEAERHDLSYLMRAERFDKYFRKGLEAEALKKTLLAMGIDLERQKNITLDLEERPKKNPRAACFPIRIPSRVILGLSPRGGVDDYETIFHEAGHAEHFASTDAALPFAFRESPDNSLTEVYSSLFEGITSEPLWVKKFTEMTEGDLEDYTKHATLGSMSFTYLYTGKLVYEIKLHKDSKRNESTSSLRKFRRIFVSSLLEQSHIRYDESQYLSYVDDSFYVAEYLRSWVAEAQLRRYLKEEFGEAWWENPGAGGFLKSIWRKGNYYSVEELTKEELGYKSGLDPRYLFGIFKERLG
jgi:hypothetical protein